MAYLESHPSPSNRATDSLAWFRATKFIKGGGLSEKCVKALHRTMRYRIEKMHLATRIKDLLGLDFPAYHEYNVDAWEPNLAESSECGKWDLDTHPKIQLFDKFYDHIFRSDMFPPKPTKEIFGYLKPERYLTIAFVENSVNIEEASRMIEKAGNTKDRCVGGLTERIKNIETVRQVAESAFETVGKRLRSRSPQKRQPNPHFGELSLTS